MLNVREHIPSVIVCFHLPIQQGDQCPRDRNSVAVSVTIPDTAPNPVDSGCWMVGADESSVQPTEATVILRIVISRNLLLYFILIVKGVVKTG